MDDESESNDFISRQIVITEWLDAETGDTGLTVVGVDGAGEGLDLTSALGLLEHAKVSMVRAAYEDE